jgi:hypothetical protein
MSIEVLSRLLGEVWNSRRVGETAGPLIVARGRKWRWGLLACWSFLLPRFNCLARWLQLDSGCLHKLCRGLTRRPIAIDTGRSPPPTYDTTGTLLPPHLRLPGHHHASLLLLSYRNLPPPPTFTLCAPVSHQCLAASYGDH